MDGHTVSEVKDMWGFISSIDWTDPWLIILVTTQITLVILSILTRRYATFQGFLFLALLIMVYFTEKINEVAARNWRYFSRQQYFDSDGMFISFVFSIPILLNCLFIICNWLYTSGDIMVKLKQAQLKRRVNRQGNAIECKSQCRKHQ